MPSFAPSTASPREGCDRAPAEAARTRNGRASSRAVGRAPADRREDVAGDEDRVALAAALVPGGSASEPLPSIHDSGFRVFSQFEAGVVLYLLGAGGIATRRFVDLGAGDGVYATTARIWP